jgi:hypothetical protein
MLFWLLIALIVGFCWVLCIGAFGAIAIFPLTVATLCGAIIVTEA